MPQPTRKSHRRMTALTLGLLALVLAAPSCPGGAGVGFRAGVCMRDITPVSPSLAAAYESAFGGPAIVNHTDPVFMAGFGDDRRATGYNDRLWARGVVLDGAGGRVAIVALDLVGYLNGEVDTIRSLVAPESGIDYAVVHSTHQHEGPDTIGIWGPRPAHQRHRLRLPRLRERRRGRLHRRGRGPPRAGARPVRHHRLGRPEPRPRRGGRRPGRGRRQGAGRRRPARPRHRRAHRRRAALDHAGDRARRCARHAGHPRQLREPSREPGQRQHADHLGLPALRARGHRGRGRRHDPLGERRPRRAPGSARHRRARPGDAGAGGAAHLPLGGGPRRAARRASGLGHPVRARGTPRP